MVEKKKRLVDPLLNFGDRLENKGLPNSYLLLGNVSHSGNDLLDDLPKEFHIDTHEKRISVLFSSGIEEIIDDLSGPNIEVINGILDEFGHNRNDLKFGILRVNENDDLIDPYLRVPAIVI